MNKHLYLIALLPPKEILNEIRLLKEEIKAGFAVSHALKLPAHITLQRPFRVYEEKEKELVGNLSGFSGNHEAFLVELQGFGTFPPRVIFVKIENHSSLIQLQSELQQYLPVEFFVSAVQQQKEIHPHITLATRDLTPEIFPEVWKKFQNRKYHKTFIADTISLFKHDGKKWHLFQNFALSSI